MHTLDEGAKASEESFFLYLLNAKHAAPDDLIESRIADLAYEIEKSVEKLQIGDSVLIPGGCREHIVIYEISLVKKGEYHFSIFNTGFGNDFGQLPSDTISSNQKRVPLFTGLSLQAVADQNFLADLLRFSIKNAEGTIPIYNAITNHLTKKHLGKQTIREPHVDQTWGTCSFDAIAAFLEYKLA